MIQHKKQIGIIFGILVILLVIVSIVLISNILHTKDNKTLELHKEDLNKAFEKVDKVKIGYRDHLVYLPTYLANSLGYYEKEGLDVELIRFDSTNDMVDSLIAGKIDAIGSGTNSVVLLTIEGKNPGLFKIYNQGYLTDEFDAILVRSSSNLDSIEDLEGKTISILPGTASSVWMNLMLEKEGLKGKVNLITTKESQQLDVLSSNSADAVFVLEPTVTIGNVQGISKTLIQSPISRYFQKDMLYTASAFSTQFVNNKPKTAEKIVWATDKAINFINKNPEKAKEYYSSFTSVDDSTEVQLPLTKYLGSNEMKKAEFQELADLFYNKGILEKKVNVDGMFLK